MSKITYNNIPDFGNPNKSEDRKKEETMMAWVGMTDVNDLEPEDRENFRKAIHGKIKNRKTKIARFLRMIKLSQMLDPKIDGMKEVFIQDFATFGIELADLIPDLSEPQLTVTAGKKDVVNTLQKQFPQFIVEIGEMGRILRTGYLSWAVKQLSLGEPQDEIVNNVQLFHQKKSLLPSKKRDIGQYQSLGELRAALENIQIKSTKAKGQGEYEKIYEDDRFLVIFPNTTEASQYYGRGTRWCIAATQSKNYFWDYSSRNVFIYFILDRIASAENPMHKIAITYGKYGGNEANENFNALDNKINLDDIGEYVGDAWIQIFSSIKKHFASKPDTDVYSLANTDDPAVINQLADRDEPEARKLVFKNPHAPAEALDKAIEKELLVLESQQRNIYELTVRLQTVLKHPNLSEASIYKIANFKYEEHWGWDDDMYQGIFKSLRQTAEDYTLNKLDLPREIIERVLTPPYSGRQIAAVAINPNLKQEDLLKIIEIVTNKDGFHNLSGGDIIGQLAKNPSLPELVQQKLLRYILEKQDGSPLNFQWIVLLLENSVTTGNIILQLLSDTSDYENRKRSVFAKKCIDHPNFPPEHINDFIHSHQEIYDLDIVLARKSRHLTVENFAILVNRVYKASREFLRSDQLEIIVQNCINTILERDDFDADTLQIIIGELSTIKPNEFFNEDNGRTAPIQDPKLEEHRQNILKKLATVEPSWLLLTRIQSTSLIQLIQKYPQYIEIAFQSLAKQQPSLFLQEKSSIIDNISNLVNREIADRLYDTHRRESLKILMDNHQDFFVKYLTPKELVNPEIYERSKKEIQRLVSFFDGVSQISDFPKFQILVDYFPEEFIKILQTMVEKNYEKFNLSAILSVDINKIEKSINYTYYGKDAEEIRNVEKSFYASDIIVSNLRDVKIPVQLEEKINDICLHLVEPYVQLLKIAESQNEDEIAKVSLATNRWLTERQEYYPENSTSQDMLKNVSQKTLMSLSDIIPEIIVKYIPEPKLVEKLSGNDSAKLYQHIISYINSFIISPLISDTFDEMTDDPDVTQDDWIIDLFEQEREYLPTIIGYLSPLILKEHSIPDLVSDEITSFITSVGQRLDQEGTSSAVNEIIQNIYQDIDPLKDDLVEFMDGFKDWMMYYVVRENIEGGGSNDLFYTLGFNFKQNVLNIAGPEYTSLDEETVPSDYDITFNRPTKYDPTKVEPENQEEPEEPGIEVRPQTEFPPVVKRQPGFRGQPQYSARAKLRRQRQQKLAVLNYIYGR